MFKTASRGPTPEKRLHDAIIDGNLRAVQRFFRSRPGADVSRPFFRTLIHMHPSGLLYGGVPPNLYDGATALHVAAWRGHAGIVTWLLRQGADPSAEDAYQRTPLHVATSNVRDLLRQVNAPCSKGATPQELAALGRITIATADEIEEWPHQECAVCLVAFVDKVGTELAMMPTCRHVFCRQCVERWLQTHNKCPMCRSRLS